MEAQPLLLRVCQVKRRAGPDVVDVPFAIVVPRHAGLKLSFKVSAHLVWRASEQLLDCALSKNNRLVEPGAQSCHDAMLGRRSEPGFSARSDSYRPFFAVLGVFVPSSM